MAKLKVYERCARCGKRNAQRANGIVVEFHVCDNPPPGPGARPARFRADSVDLVDGDFTAAELRFELERAWEAINDLRDKRWLAEAAAERAIKAAFREVFNNG